MQLGQLQAIKCMEDIAKYCLAARLGVGDGKVVRQNM